MSTSMVVESILEETKSKLTLRSHYNIAHLQPIYLLSNNFLNLMVSEIKPRQDLKGQDHSGKVKSMSHLHAAHQQPRAMSLPSINFLHLTVFKTSQTKF